jgi:hypothetical protein
MLRRLFLMLIPLLMLAGSPADAQDDGTFVDVLVAYTAGGRAQLGGTDALLFNRLSSAIAAVNDQYAAAGAPLRVRWVGTRAVFYQEQVNIDFHADLTHLMGESDGHMDELHAVRDYAAADLVILLAGTQFALYTADAPAWMGADPARGFAVVEGRYFGGDSLMQALSALLGMTGTAPAAELPTLTLNAPLIAQYRDSSTAQYPASQHLLNGGFDLDTDANGIAEFWRAVSPRSGDGRRCTAAARSGGCALRLTGSTGSTARFRQIVDGAAFAAGDLLIVTGYAQPRKARVGAVVTLIARYADSSRQTVSIRLPRGNKPYRPFAGALALSGTPQAVVLNIRFSDSGASGVVWIDDLALTRLKRY